MVIIYFNIFSYISYLFGGDTKSEISFCLSDLFLSSRLFIDKGVCYTVYMLFILCLYASVGLYRETLPLNTFWVSIITPRVHEPRKKDKYVKSK